MINEKTLNNLQVKELKDLIIAHPNSIIVHRDKLKYAGDTNSKSGKTFYKLVHSCMGKTTYYVAEDRTIYRIVAGKFVPLEHEAFKH